MKNITSAIIMILATLPALAGIENINEIKVETKPKQITVFLTGAELRHDAAVDLKTGKNLVKFTGLSSKLDPSSIIVDVEKKTVVILSVYSNNNFLAPVLDNKKIKALKDSIDQEKDQLANLKGTIETLNKEKELLYKNDAFTAKGASITEIEKSADFFRKRSNDLNAEVYKIDKQIAMHDAKLDRFKKQLAELNAAINPPSSEISALVLVTEDLKCGFELKYRVAAAGWQPKYDIRVDAISKPVNLYYKANIFNNTGVDWMDVKLKLSTADPMQGAQHPKLGQWKLNEGNYEDVTISQQSQINQLKVDNKGVDFRTVTVDELSAEFEIAQPYSILADSKPYLVDVNFKSLDAKYEYVSIPKMDKDAFLVAKVVGWNDLNLVSGDASIYFNGTYIGQSRLNIVEISDTLELSLGRDNKIAISRVKKSERNEHQVMGNYEKEVYRYEMVVKNNRDIPLTVNLLDQVPVETDSRIDIRISEISGGTYNKNDGEVSWMMNLQPGEVRKISFDFSAKYPKEIKPKYRKFRTVSCPSF